MKITKNEQMPNEFKVEMTLTLGKLLALKSSLEKSKSKLGGELNISMHKEMEIQGITKNGVIQ